MSVNEITVEEARDLLASGKAVMIDVREQDEWDAARIDGTTLAPLSQMPQAWEALDLPKDKTIIVQCKSGGRSGRVCEFVGPTAKDGQPVVNLAGGIMAWHQAGYPIIQG
ncbi:rhodanese-like domain-containing protein [uncultured Brevundimonas sp.]|uniref:rhodanese-like domain-containing protein n=1 Tax=uncultured Brevundimonas sp. TaxID=213418 RepID=UPI00262628E0|nr:rhodanese-like domain-containing protein [uncultured Brevundimonas sp.]